MVLLGGSKVDLLRDPFLYLKHLQWFTPQRVSIWKDCKPKSPLIASFPELLEEEEKISEELVTLNKPWHRVFSEADMTFITVLEVLEG